MIGGLIESVLRGEKMSNETRSTMAEQPEVVRPVENTATAEANHTQAQKVTAQMEHQRTSESTKPMRPSLYRHPVHQLIGGVCGGIADALSMDPALVRALWVVLTLGSAGAGFLAYLALWLLLPVGTNQTGMQEPAAVQLNERNVTRAGMLLIVFGGLWLLANVGILPWLWNAFWTVVGMVFWPALLIGAGMLLLKNQKEWRASFRSWKTRVRSSTNLNSTSYKVNGNTVRSAFQGMRSRIPLKRSRQDRLVLGVCGGIAQALKVDANLVRLFWILFSVGSIGTGAVIYALAGLVLPQRAVDPVDYDSEIQNVQVIDGRAQ